MTRKQNILGILIVFGLPIALAICGILSDHASPGADRAGGVIASEPPKASDASAPSVDQPDLFSRVEFHNIPKARLASVKRGIRAFLEGCPKIGATAVSGEKLEVWWYPEGWEETPAHLDVEINLSDASLADVPQGLRDPQWGGHAEFGISGGRSPGAIMEMPVPEWLCDIPVPEDVLDGFVRHWDQEKIIKPLAIVPGSF